MKHDIHEISNELYTQRKQTQIDRENKERKKKYIQDIKYTLQEEIENYVNDLDYGYSINDIQLEVLDNQDIIIDNVSTKIFNKGLYDVGKTKINLRLDIKEYFLSQFNIFFKEYKTRFNLQKEKDKQIAKNIYNDILDKLIIDFDKLNNMQKYDMKIVLKNMYEEDYIIQVFDYLDLDYSTDTKEIYYKALSELKRRKKNTIKEVEIKKQKTIPLGWKCYGILKVIDKMIK
jgi:hypothetical protein